MDKIREKIQKFMWGRYGNDRLNRVLMTLSMAFILLSFLRLPGAYLIAVLLLLWVYYRMFSKQTAKRCEENRKYMRFEADIRSFFLRKKRELQDRKTHHIYRCPNCKQKLRVPKGRGRIVIRCRKCGTEFEKKS